MKRYCSSALNQMLPNDLLRDVCFAQIRERQGRQLIQPSFSKQAFKESLAVIKNGRYLAKGTA